MVTRVPKHFLVNCAHQKKPLIWWTKSKISQHIFFFRFFFGDILNQKFLLAQNKIDSSYPEEDQVCHPRSPPWHNHGDCKSFCAWSGIGIGVVPAVSKWGSDSNIWPGRSWFWSLFLFFNVNVCLRRKKRGFPVRVFLHLFPFIWSVWTKKEPQS